MTDEYRIAQGIRAAIVSGGIIDDVTARLIASQWHGGQATALCSFATTGAITEDLLDEIESETETESEELAALHEYVEYHSIRGPVAGWSRLHW